MSNIFDLVDTWNDGAIAFTSIKMNVTDTASAAGSNLLDLQVGGVSKFTVSKSGNPTFGNGGSFEEITFDAATAGEFRVGVTPLFSINSFTKVASVASNGFFGFSGGGNNAPSAPSDVLLTRDAAGTLAQRNGANAQAFNLYNTHTDASNYERGFMKWSSNVLEIGTEAAGTGTARSMVLQRVAQIRASADADQFINMAAAGYFSFFDNAGTEPVRYGSFLEARFSWGIRWSASLNAGATKDTGIVRDSAGVVKITDGSTGAGKLIFIVPTTDPAIVGALWNNAGTLAISEG